MLEFDPKEAWLKRQQARLVLSQLCGVLNRSVRQRLVNCADVELYLLTKQIHTAAVERARVESGQKTPSYAMRILHWRGHPLRSLLDDEVIKRDRELEEKDPEAYYGSMYNLFIRERREFFLWKSENHLGCVVHTTDQHISMWRKEYGQGDRSQGKVPRPRPNGKNYSDFETDTH